MKEETKKKKTKTTTTTKKVTPKKTTTKKNSNKEIKVVKETVKTEVKKEKTNVFKNIWSGIKRVATFIYDKILNNPKLIIIALGVLVLAFIIAFANYKSKYKILVGDVVTKDVGIRLVQIDTNPKVNTFMATTATYLGEDKQVYDYVIGYFYQVGDEMKPLTYAKKSVTEGASLAELVSANSYKSIIEFAGNKSNKSNVKVFTNEAKSHLDKLHFIIKASTNKNNKGEYDINIDCPIKFVNIGA